MNRAGGFTLIETVISIVIFSVCAGGILLAFGTAIRGSAQPQRQVQAVAIAEGYLEEIMLLPVDDPDGVAALEASRDLYDDIFDYDGLSDSPPEDQDGNQIAGLDNYQVTVSVSASAALGPGGAQVPSTDAYRVDVLVTYGSEISYTLSAYRVRY